MADSVPGSKEGEIAPAEVSAVAQPLAPNPVPATSQPTPDQVTINTHLRKVADELHAVSSYVKTFLADHEVAEEVVDELASVIKVVLENVK